MHQTGIKGNLISTESVYRIRACIIRTIFTLKFVSGKGVRIIQYNRTLGIFFPLDNFTKIGVGWQIRVMFRVGVYRRSICFCACNYVF